MSAVVEAACHYLAAGWALVDLHSAPGRACTCGRSCGKSSGKHPRHLAWPARRPRAEDLGGNVGVILGAASNGLADIDLDCPEAIALADTILPRTLAFGRASARRSHRLYRAHGAVTRRLQAPDGAVILELRANPTVPHAEALQTVIPPSIHYSGEAIEWDADDGRDALDLASAVIEINATELATCAAHLAAGVLIMRHAGERAARIALLGGWVPALPAAALKKVREWVGVPDEGPPTTPTRKASGDVEAQAQAYAASYPPAVSGEGGHAHTFRLAQNLVHGFGLDDAAALRVLADWNRRCLPPWTDRELEHKVASARSAPVREPVKARTT